MVQTALAPRLEATGPAADRRRREILAAASRVFRRKGFAATGMRDVAAELGMTAGNLYYYFAGKEAILAFCQQATLDDLLAAADVVTLHTPLTRETRHLLDAPRLARLKPSALVVNCGRGGVVDETALVEALDAGRIAGAALDVYEEEPTPRLDLVRHPRVVATPHIGAQTREAQERIAHETARMVLAALAGEVPEAAVNAPLPAAGRESRS